MKPLFKMDIKNYADSDIHIRRPSARAVIRAEDGRLAMVYSRKYQYYKFPGGGIRNGEDNTEALAREVLEETGLHIKKDSIREYGSVLRLQKSGMHKNTVFEQENFYYTCSAETSVEQQNLDDYEKQSGFELQYICALDAAAVNKACTVQDDFDLVMIARDTAVLEIYSGKIPEPSVSMAEFLLKAAVKSNPGPWEQHSRYTAESAGRIAGRCLELDPERAYIYGLLHVYDGYHYLADMGYTNAARIALTHSFNRKDIRDYIGKFDIAQYAQDEISMLLADIEYDDYDCLIQMCDAIAKADGIVPLEERMNDVKKRHGYYPQKKWDRNLWLKEYFEEKMQEELYQAAGTAEKPEVTGHA